MEGEARRKQHSEETPGARFDEVTGGQAAGRVAVSHVQGTLSPPAHTRLPHPERPFCTGTLPGLALTEG